MMVFFPHDGVCFPECLVEQALKACISKLFFFNILST